MTTDDATMRRLAEELRDRGGQDMLVSPEAVLALLDRVAAAEVRAKQADDLDARNQRLTGDWKDALERAEKAEAEVGLYHGRWSDAMKSAEDLRADYEQVRQMNAAQVETITALRAEIDDLRETLDDFRAVLDKGGDDA